MLALLMFHETRGEKPKKYFRVLSCVIYTIIEHYVCIDYLACQFFFNEITVGSKHGEKIPNKILGIGIPDLLMNLMSCNGFSKKLNYIVILKFHKKYFGILFFKRIWYFGMQY